MLPGYKDEIYQDLSNDAYKKEQCLYYLYKDYIDFKRQVIVLRSIET